MLKEKRPIAERNGKNHAQKYQNTSGNTDEIPQTFGHYPGSKFSKVFFSLLN